MLVFGHIDVGWVLSYDVACLSFFLTYFFLILDDVNVVDQSGMAFREWIEV